MCERESVGGDSRGVFNQLDGTFCIFVGNDVLESVRHRRVSGVSALDVLQKGGKTIVAESAGIALLPEVAV